MPYVSFRFLDVFAALGAAPGPDTNVRAKYDITVPNSVTGGTPAYMAFARCKKAIPSVLTSESPKSQERWTFAKSA